jgi:hypothetical protein
MSRTAFSFLIILCLSNAAQAVPAAVREACRSDAIKFCDAVIYDVAKRRACMQSHRNRTFYALHRSGQDQSGKWRIC